jgi:hypothetical protein
VIGSRDCMDLAGPWEAGTGRKDNVGYGSIFGYDLHFDLAAFSRVRIPPFALN